MLGDVVVVAVLLAIPVGVFFARRAKAAGAPPGVEGGEAPSDERPQRVEHVEAFADERPEGQ